MRKHSFVIGSLRISGVAAASMMTLPVNAAVSERPLVYAVPELRVEAPQARQGVASDGTSIYAIDNSAIAKYAISDGHLLTSFEGKREDFPHLNSCTIAKAELVCASSNYPAIPHRGTVEFFDANSLAHLRTVALPENPGSLTVINRHEERWWGIFANYDGKGGVRGQDHSKTRIVEFSDDFRIVRQWSLPQSILQRIAPYSLSGGSWGPDGKLHVSGHDKPEVYGLDLPDRGDRARLLSTIAVPFFGQAIDFDPKDPTLLWGVDRKTNTVIASRLPKPSTGTSSSEKTGH